MRQGDMIVNLSTLCDIPPLPNDVKIKRAMSVDKAEILEFIEREFTKKWASETEAAFSRTPTSCYIAVKDKHVIGFACYDATAKGFAGPMGLCADARGLGIGKALICAALHSMREYGYGYAILGWIGDAAGFFQKTLNAEFIDGGEPHNSVYADLIMMD